jgi:hypothetical protein
MMIVVAGSSSNMARMCFAATFHRKKVLAFFRDADFSSHCQLTTMMICRELCTRLEPQTRLQLLE